MLPGFNHNVKHKDHIYHVQTEDSGLNNPHIITHLFVGGNIIATDKSSYEELLAQKGGQDIEEDIRALMKEQHKQMLRNLIQGKYDSAELSNVHHLNGPLPLNVDEKVLAETGGSGGRNLSTAEITPPSNVAPPPAKKTTTSTAMPVAAVSKPVTKPSMPAVAAPSAAPKTPTRPSLPAVAVKPPAPAVSPPVAPPPAARAPTTPAVSWPAVPAPVQMPASAANSWVRPTPLSTPVPPAPPSPRSTTIPPPPVAPRGPQPSMAPPPRSVAPPPVASVPDRVPIPPSPMSPPSKSPTIPPLPVRTPTIPPMGRPPTIPPMAGMHPPGALPPEILAARALTERPVEKPVTANTIFGEDLITEKSLDEVILAYLTLEESPKKR